MRISPQEKLAILDSANEVFGPDAEIWLFGSRLDDTSKGGDIDLYIEVPAVDFPVKKKIAFKLLLEDRIGEQKVDVVLHQRCNATLPIHDIARTEGIRLRNA